VDIDYGSEASAFDRIQVDALVRIATAEAGTVRNVGTRTDREKTVPIKKASSQEARWCVFVSDPLGQYPRFCRRCGSAVAFRSGKIGRGELSLSAS
jgi:hypothetical protein